MFRDFMNISEKTRERSTLQREAIKIGGSGGGWKSRSTGVDGCSNGVTVGEIALVVFYYSTSSEVGRLAAAHIHSKAMFFMQIIDF